MEKNRRVAIYIQFTWIIILLMLLFVFVGIDVISLRFGPNDQFVILGMKINTWPRFFALNVFMCVDAAINIWSVEVIQTWINHTVFNELEKTIDYSMTTTMLVANVHYAYCSIRTIFMAYILVLLQIDVFCLRILVEMCVTLVTSWSFVRLKTVVSENGYSIAGSVRPHRCTQELISR